jgi:hypothetical protein
MKTWRFSLFTVVVAVFIIGLIVYLNMLPYRYSAYYADPEVNAGNAKAYSIGFPFGWYCWSEPRTSPRENSIYGVQILQLFCDLVVAALIVASFCISTEWIVRRRTGSAKK